MRIRDTIDHDATPERVFAMLSDEGFQDRKAEATGALSHSVSITTRGDHTVIVSKRAMPTDKLPDFVKSFVGKELHLTETSDWGPAAADGSRRGRLTVTVGGAPITLDATLSLAPSGQGTRELVEGDLTAKVPLLGGKIEQAAAPAIEAAIHVERSTGATWLAG
ncbi:MAG TPA: DUF2505 domain-containing protein [Gaiellales bacterium]|nr:DUF2505 domain-containing protein [Gaiellales bacterium]